MDTISKHLSASSITPTQIGLFVEWFSVLVGERFGPQGSGTSGPNVWDVTLQDGSRCQVEWQPGSRKFVLTVPKGIADEVVELSKKALERAYAGDYGEATWWSTGFSSQPSLSEAASLHFLRTLGEHRRFQGAWKLGTEAVLNFSQKSPEGEPAILGGNQSIELVFRSVGPGYGNFARTAALQKAMRIRTVTTFITGVPLDWLPSTFPADEEKRLEAQRLLAHSSIKDLHLDGFAIWPALSDLLFPDNSDAFDRVYGAMLAYEHGLTQKTADASLVFFVTAIEALTVPSDQTWANTRITKRFVEFLELVCPEAIDDTMNHSNFKQAFGNVTRKRFPERLYGLRSRPIHTGHLTGLGAFAFPPIMEPTIQVALISGLAKSAILAFLQKPVTLLWGNPKFDPRVQFNPTQEEYSLIQKQAQESGKSVEEWIKDVLLAHTAT